MKLALIPFLALSFLLSSAQAKTSNLCDESVAHDIAKFLEKEEPGSDLHLLYNQAGELVGLTDANNIYPTMDFVQTRSIGKNKQMNIFAFDSVLVTAEYIVFGPNGLPSCKTTHVSIAQDDQDQED